MQNGLKILKVPARYGERSVTVVGWCVRTGYLEYALLPGWRTLRTRQWRAGDMLGTMATKGMKADSNHYFASEPSGAVREIFGTHVRGALVCTPAAWPELPRPPNWEALCNGSAFPENAS